MQGEKQQGGTTANAGAKFALGLLAGIAAVLLPRLLADRRIRNQVNKSQRAGQLLT